MKTFYVLLFLLIFLGIYFLPTIIARKDAHFSKIFFLNFFGAWTGILWIVAFGWACFFKTPKLSEAQRIEKEILKLVQQKNGKVTPIEIASEITLTMTVEQAKTELDKFCVNGIAEVKLTPEGNIFYEFHGFLTNEEKQNAITTKSCWIFIT